MALIASVRDSITVLMLFLVIFCPFSSALVKIRLWIVQFGLLPIF